jgi:hypothetical protein
MPNQPSNTAMYGPIAMQKRRLENVEALIAHYQELIRQSGDREKFTQALERAIQQRARLMNWLAIHEKARSPGQPPEKAQSALAGLVC